MPRAVKTLLAANAVCYVLSLVVIHWISDGRDTAASILEHLILQVDGVLSGQLWQLGSYMFLHDFGSPMHLLFNMLVLWMFGTPLEAHWGARRFTFFYFLCGIGAGVAFVIAGYLAPGLFGQAAVGASGAVLGLTVAFGFTFPEQYIYLYFMIPVRAKWIGLVTVVIDLLWFMSDRSIAVAAHWGGMLTGYLLVSGFWRPGRWGGRRGRPRDPRPPRVRDLYPPRDYPPSRSDDDFRRRIQRDGFAPDGPHVPHP